MLLAACLCLPPCRASGQVNIWEGTHQKKVEMKAYAVAGQGNPAVVVCPGGSYFWHDMKGEGAEVAQWLNGHGIAAFVLHYRTAYVPAFVTHFREVFRGNRYPDPLDDLRQALRWLRAHADAYGIDPGDIGVMGFSAGGHLAMLGAELLEREDRPRYVAALYPVVTLSGPYAHKRSRRALLGDDLQHDRRMQDSLSVERHVPGDCPPVFLANCLDDPVVHYRNAELLDSALTAQRVPHLYIQYRTGGHGFGASEKKGSEEARTWKDAFLRWLHALNKEK